MYKGLSRDLYKTLLAKTLWTIDWKAYYNREVFQGNIFFVTTNIPRLVFKRKKTTKKRKLETAIRLILLRFQINLKLSKYLYQYTSTYVLFPDKTWI